MSHGSRQEWWRRIAVAGVAVMSVQPMAARAEDAQRTADRVVGGVMSGLLGVQQDSPAAAYSAHERERVAQLLQSGDYATSRQGEPVDLIVFGIPLTSKEHVYTAKPTPPSRMSP